MTLRMADGLPEGLVTSTDAIRVDIERVDRVAVEDITQLWRGKWRPAMPPPSSAAPRPPPPRTWPPARSRASLQVLRDVLAVPSPAAAAGK
jgi:hypothetical protein